MFWLVGVVWTLFNAVLTAPERSEDGSKLIPLAGRLVISGVVWAACVMGAFFWGCYRVDGGREGDLPWVLYATVAGGGLMIRIVVHLLSPRQPSLYRILRHCLVRQGTLRPPNIREQFNHDTTGCDGFTHPSNFLSFILAVQMLSVYSQRLAITSYSCLIELKLCNQALGSQSYERKHLPVAWHIKKRNTKILPIS